MSESAGFEPTESQDGVGTNMFTLIDPSAIPTCRTDYQTLQEAAEALRTGGESLAGEAEDMKSTWQGLQTHYSAPESETLFTKMDPVVDRGEDLETDLGAVASALENLAAAAKTAQQSLSSLRREAQAFWNEQQDKKVWWFDKDDETDEFALQKNLRLKTDVNSAWETFNEAETACANAITALTGGPTFASPDQAGPGDIVYGLPSDAADLDLEVFSFDSVNWVANSVAGWAASEFHPSLAEFDSSRGQAVWDVVVTDALWGSAVGLTSKLGFWHADNGWRFDPSGRWENTKAAWTDAWMETVTLVGVHDDDGWLLSGGLDGRDWGGTWDRWTTNLDASKDELWEGYTAWSRREDDPAYSDATIVTNVVMMTGGLPLKLFDTIAGAGGSPGGPFAPDGSFPGITGITAGGGDWPSSPLPNTDRERTSTTERFGDEITELNESLLDPNRFRDTSSDSPSTPTYPSSPLPPYDNPSPQDSGTPSPRAGDEDTPRRDDDQDGQDGQDAPRDRDEEGVAPNSPYDDQDDAQTPDTPTPVNHPDIETQRGDSDAPRTEDSPTGRPYDRDDDDTSASPNDARAESRDATQDNRDGIHERPRSSETATRGGEGDGDQPPRDQTGDEFEHDSFHSTDESPGGFEDPEVDLPLDDWREAPFEVSNDLPRDIVAEIQESFDIISSVHEFPEGMKTIQFKPLSSGGTGVVGNYDRLSRTISFDPGAPDLRSTLIHEIGHAIDHAAPTPGLASAMPSSPQMRDWVSTVHASEKYGELSARLKENPGDGRLKYLAYGPELWARSYTQWVAERSGDGRLKQEVQRQLSLPGYDRYRQWEDSDFHPIAEALDKVFREDWNL